MAPVPLLWVVPLALYLVSFIVVFARWPATAPGYGSAGRVVPMLLLALTVSLLIRATEPLAGVAALHLTAFAGRLPLCATASWPTSSRAPEHLTGFYLAMSVGGVLGGSFNALVAPVLFADLGMVEYPIALCLAALVRPTRAALESPPTRRTRSGCWSSAFAGLVAAVLIFTAMPAVAAGRPPGRHLACDC